MYVCINQFLSACLYMCASINQYIYPAVWCAIVTTICTSLTHYVQCGGCARCSWGK